MSILSCIKSLIKRGKTTLPGNDSGLAMTAQIQYMNKVTTSHIINPAGFGHNPTPGNLAIIFNVSGVEDNLSTIVTNDFNRIKNLVPGETVIYNTVTKSHIIFKQDGSIEINAPVININGDLNVSGKTNLGADTPAIARVGDTVQTIITSGSSAGTWDGTIITGSPNNNSN